jgi:hypothetical protein
VKSHDYHVIMEWLLPNMYMGTCIKMCGRH